MYGTNEKGYICQGGVVGYPRGLWIPRPGFESRPWPFPVLLTRLHDKIPVPFCNRSTPVPNLQSSLFAWPTITAQPLVLHTGDSGRGNMVIPAAVSSRTRNGCTRRHGSPVLVPAVEISRILFPDLPASCSFILHWVIIKGPPHKNNGLPGEKPRNFPLFPP